MFVVVHRDDYVLTYRQGKYRESADGFLNQRTIGFRTLLGQKERTFLDTADHGILTAGLSATYADLGVPFDTVNVDDEKLNAAVEFLIVPENKSGLVCVVNYECPTWLEPLKKRLAINALSWLPTNSLPNHLDDFDDWSKQIIPELFPRYIKSRVARS